jgi:hypothetical protein
MDQECLAVTVGADALAVVGRGAAWEARRVPQAPGFHRQGESSAPPG